MRVITGTCVFMNVHECYQPHSEPDQMTREEAASGGRVYVHELKKYVKIRTLRPVCEQVNRHANVIGILFVNMQNFGCAKIQIAVHSMPV